MENFGNPQVVLVYHGIVHVNSAACAKVVTANHAATTATPTAESKFKFRIAVRLLVRPGATTPHVRDDRATASGRQSIQECVF
jgi:hypothetical protein